jgi:hypothetical protein
LVTAAGLDNLGKYLASQAGRRQEPMTSRPPRRLTRLEARLAMLAQEKSNHELTIWRTPREPANHWDDEERDDGKSHRCRSQCRWTASSPDPTTGLNKLGLDGDRLFTWFSNGDTPSRFYWWMKMSAASAAACDGFIARIGAVISGRRTYDVTNGWDGKGELSGAPPFVVTHHVPESRVGATSRSGRFPGYRPLLF